MYVNSFRLRDEVAKKRKIERRNYSSIRVVDIVLYRQKFILA